MGPAASGIEEDGAATTGHLEQSHLKPSPVASASVTPAHSKWNHSVLQCAFSHAIMAVFRAPPQMHHFLKLGRRGLLTREPSPHRQPSVVSARRRLAAARASLVHLPLPLSVLRRRC